MSAASNANTADNDVRPSRRTPNDAPRRAPHGNSRVRRHAERRSVDAIGRDRESAGEQQARRRADDLTNVSVDLRMAVEIGPRLEQMTIDGREGG